MLPTACQLGQHIREELSGRFNSMNQAERIETVREMMKEAGYSAPSNSGIKSVLAEAGYQCDLDGGGF